MQELSALYNKQLDEHAAPLPELPIQYVDFAVWQRQHLTATHLQKKKEYWQQQLAEIPSEHTLPLDFMRPIHKQSEGALLNRALSAETVSGLQAASNKLQVTPFMLCHGVLAILLSRWSNSQDIVIGTPVANRLHAEVQPLIGFFVNTLVLRTEVKNSPLAHYFSQIDAVNRAAQANQTLPFEQLVEIMNVERNPSLTPLFQIALNTSFYDENISDNTADSSSETTALHMQPRGVDVVSSKFDLQFDVGFSRHSAELGSLSLVFDIALFTSNTMCRLLDEFHNLLQNLADHASTLSADALGQLAVNELHSSAVATQWQPTSQQSLWQPEQAGTCRSAMPAR